MPKQSKYSGYGYALPVTELYGGEPELLEALNVVMDGYYKDFDQFEEEMNFGDYWRPGEILKLTIDGVEWNVDDGALVVIGESYEDEGREIMEQLFAALNNDDFTHYLGDVEVEYMDYSEDW